VTGPNQGASLAKQVVESFGYWNWESAQYLDLVFFGWYKEGEDVGFQKSDGCAIFRECCSQVASLSKWHYKGETDVLLVNFEVPVQNSGKPKLGDGYLSFKESMWLPVEAMIQNGTVRSLDGLVNELIREAKNVYNEAEPGGAGVFEISDRIGWHRGRKSLWDVLKRLFLREFGRVYDDLRPFALCDLRPRHV
jgi:hypothetical protein